MCVFVSLLSYFNLSPTDLLAHADCTGHSLGGALATLFAFEVAAAAAAAAAASSESISPPIPTPVTCVSVASPRVGDLSFQKAFRHLELCGAIRHLRIANAGDPVTIMPKSSSKKLFAMLSPISYIAFKLQDQDFAERETYRHTGLKLKLIREGKNDDGSLLELSYDGITSAKQELEKDDEDADEAANANESERPGSWWFQRSSSRTSRSTRDVPNVVYHFGTCYAHRLAKVKDELSGKTLNELYVSMAQGSSTTTTITG